MGLLTQFRNSLLRLLDFPSKMTIIHQPFHFRSSGNLAESVQCMDLIMNGPAQSAPGRLPVTMAALFGDTEA